MAQTGFTPIKLYASTTAAATPLAANLDNTNGAELAINITDGKLFYKDNSGVVQIIASKAAAAGVTSFTAGTTGLTPSTATSGAVTLAGTLAIANGGTGLTALGTGVQTAIGVNVGTAGAVVVNGGALGTPSSGTVTNLTGTASININGTVGATTATTGAFTTLAASSTVSGAGFSTYFASPPALGTTAPAEVKATTGWAANLTLTDAATVAWDTSVSQVATFTFVSTNRTMGAPTNLKNGAFYALAVIQNGGSNTLTWNSVFKWAAGTAPTLSTAAGAKDYFTFRSDGTNLYQQGISQAVA
jgi:hypothetical protein